MNDDDVYLTLPDCYRYTGTELPLDSYAAQRFAKHEAFRPGRLLVITAGWDGNVLGVAYSEPTDPPELGMKSCLAALDGDAATAICYSDEPVSDEPPPDGPERFAAAEAAAAEFGIDLVNWIMCDGNHFRYLGPTF